VVAQSVYDCALHIIVGYIAYNEDNEPIKSVVNSLPKIEALAMQPQNDNQLTHPPFGKNGDRSTLRILLGATACLKSRVHAPWSATFYHCSCVYHGKFTVATLKSFFNSLRLSIFSDVEMISWPGWESSLCKRVNIKFWDISLNRTNVEGFLLNPSKIVHMWTSPLIKLKPIEFSHLARFEMDLN
jgi:hypothetical protein